MADLYDGYDNYFEGRAEKPVKRRKHDRQHYHTRGSIKVNFKRGMLTIPQAGEHRTVEVGGL